MNMKICLALVGLWSSTTVLAARQGMQAFERVHSAPQGWKAEGAPDPGARLTFRISLVPESKGLLEETLRQVSDPSSARYGQYLSRDGLRDVMKPSAEGEKAVLDWLTASGISRQKIVTAGNWISFSTTTQEANELLDTNFLTYRSTVKPGSTIIRTRNVFLPQSVMQYVQMVHPTTFFPKLQQAASPLVKYSRNVQAASPPVKYARNVQDGNSSIIPCDWKKLATAQCVKDLYKFGDFVPKKNISGSIGVVGFTGQYPSHSDLDLLVSRTSPWAVGANYTTYSINNGTLTESKPPGGEANLDIQYTVLLTYPMRNTFLSVGGKGQWVKDLNFPTPESNLNEPFLELFKSLLEEKDPSKIPHTISISYAEEEQSTPPTYARTVCDQVAALGARGVSVVTASGDWGAGWTCQTNDGKNTTRFLPIFPASCPWITSVGSTTHHAPEIAIDFSSGGFSDLWPRPWYQKEAVPGFFSQVGDVWKGLYNPNGRGFPDVATYGNGFVVIVDGKEEGIGGTSASAPVMASVVALLNAKRLEDGKPTVGFVNPWLYSLKGKGLTDITGGGSTGCTGQGYNNATTVKVPYASWNATTGWDAVTGLGTPLLEDLLKLLPTFDAVKQTPP